jgi:hypothetical protein
VRTRRKKRAAAQDDELADFLCKVQVDVVEKAGRLLAQRTAE